jgi:16S rRNA (cytosine1402-N4)-methyltransferase
MKTTTEYTHTPVLTNEILHGLNLQPDGIYIDCTFGRGGHSKAILQHLSEQGRLFAFDKDPEAISAINKTMLADHRFSLQQGSYTMLGQLVKENGIQGRINGILFDLGVSSPQFDDPDRGFSFQYDAYLDMRMDNSIGVTASDWLNSAEQKEISDVLFQYGDERFAKKIARSIIKARQDKPITRTHQLADLVASVIPVREKDKHPATRTFQAIRILINDELNDLKEVLGQTIEALAPGGRLLFISFHSLEDRLVKRFIRDESKGDYFPPDLPITQNVLKPRLKAVGKAIYPTQDEIKNNPRARSAVLRIAERITT